LILSYSILKKLLAQARVAISEGIMDKNFIFRGIKLETYPLVNRRFLGTPVLGVIKNLHFKFYKFL